MNEQLKRSSEFDPTQLQYAEVECISCDKRYTCTPFSDYYGSQGITNDEGVFIDGRCETCFLAKNGFDTEGYPLDQ